VTALVKGSCRLFGCRIDYAGLSDPGRVRRCNEDGLLLLPGAGVFAVADGLGGLDAGDLASRTALENLKDLYTNPQTTNTLRSSRTTAGKSAPLKEIIAIVNARTYQQKIAVGRNMATTLAMVQLQDETVSLAHVGDSRIYHWRDGVLDRVTSDHSLVNELYRKGALTATQVEQSPQRHVITRAIGAELTVKPTVRNVPVIQGDLLLLCTDGLTGMLPDRQIAAIIQTWHGDVGRTVQQLVQAANDAGGHDNITAVILAINGEKARDKD
jgi:serine/threonine protein phosphatase PrpC